MHQRSWKGVRGTLKGGAGVLSGGGSSETCSLIVYMLSCGRDLKLLSLLLLIITPS